MVATFESAARGLEQMGASVQERELVDLIARHCEHEDALIEQYKRLVENAASPAVQYLVQLVVEDEQRHHRLLAEVANTIAWGWSANSPGAAAPELPPRKDSQVQLTRQTKELLDSEERDRSQLRRLRKALKPYEETTLWALIVDLILLDTEKHTQILRFIARHIS